LFFAQASLQSSYFTFSTATEMTGVYQHAQLFSIDMRVSQHFCPGSPGTVILPIIASQVARIMGVSHQHSDMTYFLYDSHFDWGEMESNIVLICISFMAKEAKYLFMYFCTFVLLKILLNSFACSLIVLLALLVFKF
jgi:hypothetical protein